MKSRAELDAEWAQFRRWLMIGGGVEKEVMRKKLDELLTAERAVVDREAQARAIRLAAKTGDWSSVELESLADRIESGQLEVPY